MERHAMKYLGREHECPLLPSPDPSPSAQDDKHGEDAGIGIMNSYRLRVPLDFSVNLMISFIMATDSLGNLPAAVSAESMT